MPSRGCSAASTALRERNVTSTRTRCADAKTEAKKQADEIDAGLLAKIQRGCAIAA